MGSSLGVAPGFGDLAGAGLESHWDEGIEAEGRSQVRFADSDGPIRIGPAIGESGLRSQKWESGQEYW
jgi:hypothetical protein